MKLFIALAASGLLALTVWLGVHAEVPAAKPLQKKEAPRPPPQMTFGVIQCGEVIALWTVLQDGTVWRADATNHPVSPEEYNAYLEWAGHPRLNKGQPDIYVLPCPDGPKKEIP